jgi:hypothetical protein
MAAELRMLQEQQQQLSNTLAQALAQLADTIKAISARIDETTAVSRKSFADQGRRSRTSRSTWRDAGARAGNRHPHPDARRRVEALRLTVAALPSMLAQAAQAAAAAAVAAQQSLAPTTTDPSTSPAPPISAVPVGPSPAPVVVRRQHCPRRRPRLASRRIASTKPPTATMPLANGRSPSAASSSSFAPFHSPSAPTTRSSTSGEALVRAQQVPGTPLPPTTS